ncbi:human immunodeficiency virus type I enhancer-binding protein 2 homolog isoform X2 [Megalops cyprinoides]|uniref:human immunodeficiency virus type I enhancer-binding protein 2 homolog isoform X2 n=1 Tax=Megalops cyprinoides TaxID=118141 RepID=UPI001863CCA7|nr:human immunodeficiency virus type I enhancer-binding protein 2 homolog isoform X2 [Megalops cyprinoides]
MEPLEAAAGQKCTKEPREKSPLQRKWLSEPTASTKRSTFADSQGKRRSQREGNQSGDAGTADSLEKGASGTPPSPAVSQPSHEKQFPQHFPGAYFRQLPHPYPQQAAVSRDVETFPAGAKPRLQASLDAQGWPFAGQLQALPPDDLLPGRSRSHGGGFPHRKSPTFPFSKYPQAGREQPEDLHRKEQKPKKPGKYICHYCGRACAKPSVLKKHIRSHTGERPYPCVPCGFSFKTKSNLYKHRKSHAHAIKAGLVPCSELASARGDADAAFSVGEAEVHSDGELSTDTDEDAAEGLALLEKSSPLAYASFEADKSTTERDGGETASTESGEELTGTSAKVPLLIVPKQGTMSAAAPSPKFADVETSPAGPREGGGDEFHSVKQRLALRLHEKKGQDSESSYNLLSPHSKGSTDSGYFSRSESAEQQVSPPITNAKSYEEIMFGKYYRPSPRPRQSITVGMATVAHKDTNVADLTDKPSVVHKLAMGKFAEDCMSSHLFTKDENMVDPVNLNTNIFLRGAITELQRSEGFDRKQYPPSQVNPIHLEAPSDTASLMRSNSMPTSSATNLDVPPGLRGSHSFDERMTSDDVFYPSPGGLRRLRRQGAFELSAHEGHAESESHPALSKSAVSPPGAAKSGERCALTPELKGYASYGAKVGMEGYPEFQSQLMYQRQVMETATRKRRKEKSVGDEEDSPSHYASDHSVEMLGSPGDYDSKQVNQESLRTTPTGKGHLHSVRSQSDSIDMGIGGSSEDRVLIQDSDRKTPVNVISVIQHTNSLSRPGSFEKSDSVDYPCYLQGKLTGSYSEHSDSENTEEVQSMDSLSRSESIEQQQSEVDMPAQQRHVAPKLVRQPNILVPEIRVTEEPDKPEKGPEPPVKEPEKHVEEFQWPQRSETLSQLPAEKLPPKKKRLRLAELEHSSGESSFESTCTSLSRSPSQESNLSHSSSLSMSFDREESVKLGSPMRPEDPNKQSEFLTVPGSGHQHHQREMRRSSSEQAPCTLPSESLEIRSKSFDYGSLSPLSRQGEVYASASSMKERRRGYLVRQASLSVHPETGMQDKGSDMNIKQEHLEQTVSGLHRGASSPLAGTSHGAPVADAARNKRNVQPVLGLHNRPLQQSISEEDRQEGHPLMQKAYHLPGWQPSESDHQTHEFSSQEVAWHPASFHSGLAQSPFLPFQPGTFWHPELSQRHKQHVAFQTQQLQKLHIRQPTAQQAHHKPQQTPQLQQIQEQGDSEPAEFASDQSYQYIPRGSPHHLSNLLSKAFTESPGLLHPNQPVLSVQNARSQPSLPSMLVPVRVQTNVPSYATATYTSVSQILVPQAQSANPTSAICKVTDDSALKPGLGFNLAQILGQPGPLLPYPFWKVPDPPLVQLNTGIPLSLTCGSIVTTDASSMGSSKRLLSPASSLELFTEIKQQKRVKEERMYGQIVEELSAVELGNSSTASDAGKLQKPGLEKDDGSADHQEGMASPPLSGAQSSKLSSFPSQEEHRTGRYSPPRPMQTDSPDGRESPEELEVDEPPREAGSDLASALSAGGAPEVRQATDGKTWGAAAAIGGASLLTADVQRVLRFPSLRTTASVSWCFLSYTKPTDAQTAPHSSVYASWCVSSNNPNPPGLNTKTALALLCSKQRKNTETFTMAAMCQPGTSKLVSSYLWQQRLDQVKPELMQLDMNKFEKKVRGVSSRERVKEGHREKEATSKPAEPTRIKIFEGGYKSNEDYIYVRGRGRGKYICEECGIRCKKPSMLKKHIRSHTDVRPYVCKFCNFAFKTKGNLTKHMKSKAHMKKCLELGVPVTSVDDGEAEEADNVDEGRRDSGKAEALDVVAEHQFSDAEDSEGAEEEGDDIEEDDDEDDDYDGDSTPKTRSRSTSPRPYGSPAPSVTAVAASQGSSPELQGPAPKPPLCSYFLSLPSIQITPLAASGDQEDEQQSAGERSRLQGASLSSNVAGSMEEDRGLSPIRDSSPSRLSSLGCEPASRRYLSPRRDLSPRGRLSPRREASPLRHISPKRRDLSPRRHLSPVPPRDLSPRSRHRGMIRAVSPRRGSNRHLHSAPWDLGQYLLPEAGLELRKSSLQGLRLSGEAVGARDPVATVNQGLFSHLPLHSQRQVRTALPMIPIGGIQVVHSAPTSVAGPAPPVQLPPQKSTWKESGAEASLRPREASASLLRKEKLPSPAASPASPGVSSPSPGPAHGDSAGVGEEDGRQDESVQTCTRAIASLRIASEDAPDRPAQPADPRHPWPPLPSSAGGERHAVPHFSGSERQRSQAGVSATPTEPSSEHDRLAASEAPPSHPAVCSKSANERLLDQQVLRETSTSAKTGKDSPKEAMDYR